MIAIKQACVTILTNQGKRRLFLVISQPLIKAWGNKDPDSRSGTNKPSIQDGAPRVFNNVGRVVLADNKISVNLLKTSATMMRNLTLCLFTKPLLFTLNVTVIRTLLFCLYQ